MNKTTTPSAQSRTARRSLLLLAIGLLACPLLFAAGLQSDDVDGVAILPSSVELFGPGATQRFLVHRVQLDRLGERIQKELTFEVAAPGIVKIDGDRLVAVADGETELTVSGPYGSATAQITVRGVGEPQTWSFRNHVQSVLAKEGCNSGACHGAAAGQGGFKLSLRGYDSHGDFAQITRQANGRRIVPTDPGRSLLLLKPTQTTPHKGGQRFETDSLEYRVLSEWIAAGTPPPMADDAKITELEIFPKSVVLRPGIHQQIVVLAHFSDGRVEDVTQWAKYSSTSTTVAQVDDDGIVSVVGHGESAVTAWYLSRIAIATISVPYDQDVNPNTFTNAPRRNFIDELVNNKLASLNIPPSSQASDAEFLRRAYIDTIGVLPTASEAGTFLRDQSTSEVKRDRLIEALLNRSEFVDYWSYKWSDLLLVNSRKVRGAAMWAYYGWIRQKVEANTPWDEFTRQLVTATGSTLENGATNFFLLHQDPRDMAETVSIAFMGLSINCAKCHNHPLEKWTNGQYYGMANLFSRVRTKNTKSRELNLVFASTQGELTQPLTGLPQPPRPLDGKALPFDSTEDRRIHLAKWLTDRSNPYFSRAISNRVWANFMGVGLVEKVDDLRVTNPASNEKLLSALADHLADNDFDLKALMRTILQSVTYQRSSKPLPSNAQDARFYSRYYPRRLKAEVLLDAFSQVTGAPTSFRGYPEGWRAMQLPDSNVNSYFLRSFGRPNRIQTCECERTAEPSVAQVLHIANGDTLNGKLEAKNNYLKTVTEGEMSESKLVEDAYLRALARFPSDRERGKLAAVLSSVAEGEKRAAIEDLYWSILSTKEFLFNH